MNVQLSADTELTMFAHTTERGPTSEGVLNLLASWTATLDVSDTRSFRGNKLAAANS